MSDAINALNLMSLDEAKAYLNLKGEEYNVVLGMIANGVSARMQSAMERRWRSRSWVHDGSTLPRLRSHGGSVLWLPNVPVTSVSVLKVDPNGSALTRGWNSDFTVNADTGRIELLNGATFWNRDEVVEVTYAGGYLDAADAGNASESYVWGYDDRSADVRLAALQQLKAEWQRWKNEDEGVIQRSEETVSLTLPQTEFIPIVQGVIDRYRFDPMPVGSFT